MENDLIQMILSEYGLLVLVLLIAVYVLYKRNVELGDKAIEAILDSTKILTELKTLLRNKNDKTNTK